MSCDDKVVINVLIPLYSIVGGTPLLPMVCIALVFRTDSIGIRGRISDSLTYNSSWYW